MLSRNGTAACACALGHHPPCSRTYFPPLSSSCRQSPPHLFLLPSPPLSTRRVTSPVHQIGPSVLVRGTPRRNSRYFSPPPPPSPVLSPPPTSPPLPPLRLPVLARASTSAAATASSSDPCPCSPFRPDLRRYGQISAVYLGKFELGRSEERRVGKECLL